jgi:hypothetical protein
MLTHQAGHTILATAPRRNLAELAAHPRRQREILKSRGNSPRLYLNTLVFLAADKGRLQDLDEAVRRFLARESILAKKDQQCCLIRVRTSELTMALARATRANECRV